MQQWNKNQKTPKIISARAVLRFGGVAGMRVQLILTDVIFLSAYVVSLILTRAVVIETVLSENIFDSVTGFLLFCFVLLRSNEIINL